MRVVHVLVRRELIGARDDDHADPTASLEEIAERVAVAHPRAAVMERHRRGVVRDDAAGAQAGGVGMDASKIVEPELRIESARIVFDERQLRPAHRPIEPVRIRIGRIARRLGRRWGFPRASEASRTNADAGQRRHGDKVTPRNRAHAPRSCT